MAKIEKMTVGVGVECSENMMRFCVDMLNIYLQDHRKTHAVITLSETPQGEIPYQRIAIEEKNMIDDIVHWRRVDVEYEKELWACPICGLWTKEPTDFCSCGARLKKWEEE